MPHDLFHMRLSNIRGSFCARRSYDPVYDAASPGLARVEVAGQER